MDNKIWDRDADRRFEEMAKTLSERKVKKKKRVEFDGEYDGLDMDPRLMGPIGEEYEEDDENDLYLRSYARNDGRAPILGTDPHLSFHAPLSDKGNGEVDIRNVITGESGTFTRATTAMTRKKLAAGDKYLSLTGLSGTYVSAPDRAALDITGPIDLRAKVAMNDWAPAAAQRLVAKRGNANSYDFHVAAGGVLGFYKGTGSGDNWNSTVATGFAAGSTHWVRVTYDPASGQKFFYTSEDGHAWTQLGGVVTDTGSLVVGEDALAIGMMSDGASSPLAGKVFYAEVRDGINGKPVARFDASQISRDATTATFGDTTWTLNGGAKIVDTQLVSVASGVPRSYYDVDGNYLGYLAEGARTNLGLASQTLEDSARWNFNNASAVADAAVAPDGTVTADKLVEDTTSGNHGSVQPITWTNAAHTLSVHLKAAERTTVRVGMWDGTSSFDVDFNLSAGTVTFEGTNTTGTVESVGGGWYRCSVTSEVAMAAAAGDFYVRMQNGTSYQGDGASGMYQWGAQVEAASFASSYIPTTTAAVTRNVDALSYSGVGRFIDSVVGTAYAEWSVFGEAAYTGVISSTGTSSRMIGMVEGVQIAAYDGSSALLLGVASINTQYRQAHSWAGSTQKGSVNGGAVESAVFDGSWNFSNDLRIGNIDGGAGNVHFGTVKDAQIFKRQLPDAQLQAMTA